MKGKYFLRFGVFLLALMTIFLVMQKNVSAQFIPWYQPAFFFNPFLRSAAVVTGGGAVPAVDGL